MGIDEQFQGTYPRYSFCRRTRDDARKMGLMYALLCQHVSVTCLSESLSFVPQSARSCYLFHSTSRSYGQDNKPEFKKKKKVVLLVGNLDSFKSRIRSE